MIEIKSEMTCSHFVKGISSINQCSLLPNNIFFLLNTTQNIGYIKNDNLMVFNIMVPYTPTTYSSVHIFQSKNNNILFVAVCIHGSCGSWEHYHVRHNGKGERSLLLCCLDKYSLLLFDFSRHTTRCQLHNQPAPAT